MVKSFGVHVCAFPVILTIFRWSAAEQTRDDLEMRAWESPSSSASSCASEVDDAVCLLSKSWAMQRRSKNLLGHGSAQKLRGWGVEVSKEQDANCPISVAVTGAEDMQDKRMGKFTKTDLLPSDLHDQRPIYINKHNQYLYYWSEFAAWRIGPDYTKEEAGITSLANHHAGCPMEALEWHAWDGRLWKRKHIIAEAQLEANTVNVHFGIFTSPLPKYAEQLEAVLKTWGRDVAPGKLTVVGVDGDNPNVSYKPAPNCKDGHVWNTGISCKEATLLIEGHRSDADWMVIVGSDNYVLPRNFEKRLSRRNPDIPEILAIWGCGDGLYCEDKQGGLCGGGGYAISRRALDLMVGDGAKSEKAFLKESKETAKTVCSYWSDQVTSCIARRRGVRQVQLFGLNGWPICEFDEAQCEFDSRVYGHVLEEVDPLPLTFHYIEPENMLKLHQMKNEIDDTRAGDSLLQMNRSDGKTHRSDGKTKENDHMSYGVAAYERHRAAYIRRMNAIMASGNLTRMAEND